MITSRPVDREGAFAILNGMFYASARGALALLDEAESKPETWVGRSSVIQIQCRPALQGRFLVQYAPENHSPLNFRTLGEEVSWYSGMDMPDWPHAENMMHP
jgi:hypothetical protein